jgi:hypothetical protein
MGSNTTKDGRNSSKGQKVFELNPKKPRQLWKWLLGFIIVAIIAAAIFFFFLRPSGNDAGRFSPARPITAADLVDGQLPDFADNEWVVIFDFPENGLSPNLVFRPIIRIYTNRSTILGEAAGLINHPPNIAILDDVTSSGFWRQSFIVGEYTFRDVIASFNSTLNAVYVGSHHRSFNPNEGLYAKRMTLPTARWASGSIVFSAEAADVVANYHRWRWDDDDDVQLVLRAETILYRLTDEAWFNTFHFLERPQ